MQLDLTPTRNKYLICSNLTENWFHENLDKLKSICKINLEKETGEKKNTFYEKNQRSKIFCNLSLKRDTVWGIEYIFCIYIFNYLAHSQPFFLKIASLFLQSLTGCRTNKRKYMNIIKFYSCDRQGCWEVPLQGWQPMVSP